MDWRENKDVPFNMAQGTKMATTLRWFLGVNSQGPTMNHPQAITIFMCFIKTIPKCYLGGIGFAKKISPTISILSS
jgi:hypothetical protein